MQLESGYWKCKYSKFRFIYLFSLFPINIVFLGKYKIINIMLNNEKLVKRIKKINNSISDDVSRFKLQPFFPESLQKRNPPNRFARLRRLNQLIISDEESDVNNFLWFVFLRQKQKIRRLKMLRVHRNCFHELLMGVPRNKPAHLSERPEQSTPVLMFFSWGL